MKRTYATVLSADIEAGCNSSLISSGLAPVGTSDEDQAAFAKEMVERIGSHLSKDESKDYIEEIFNMLEQGIMKEGEVVVLLGRALHELHDQYRGLFMGDNPLDRLRAMLGGK